MTSAALLAMAIAAATLLLSVIVIRGDFAVPGGPPVRGRRVVALALMLITAAFSSVVLGIKPTPLVVRLVEGTFVLGLLGLVAALTESRLGRTLVCVGAVAVLIAVGYSATLRVTLTSATTVHTFGAIASGHPGITAREGPGPEFPRTGPLVRDGTEVTIVCMVSSRPAPGVVSRRWARTREGSWLSAAYLDVPKDPAATPVIPPCPAQSIPEVP